MNHSTSDLISFGVSIVTDLALLGCGLYYMVFARQLRERREAAAQASRTAKPPPDYFRLGLVLAICGAGLLYLNFLR